MIYRIADEPRSRHNRVSLMREGGMPDEARNLAPLSERQQRMYDFLNAMRVGVLTCVDPNGEPHGTVVYFTIEHDFTMCFLTRDRTKKFDNLTRNNHVMLVVFDLSSQTVAQVTGKTELITQAEAINEIAAEVFKTSLNTSEAGVPPIAKLVAGGYIGFCIKPDQIRMASYVRPDSGDYDRIFESIESFELVI